MKQLQQSVRNGVVSVVEVPAPGVSAGRILVRTAASLISAGTERTVVDFAEKNLLAKARSRPDLVRQVIDKAMREGLLTAFESVQNRLDQPMAMGYSSAGTVIGVGADVGEFKVGDRVACAGGGYAVHGEIVSVPRNLAVTLPEPVDFESAAFTTVGAIALQGIRLAEVKLGEVIAVIGLGLIGQLTVQMLKAAGAIVIGMDIAAPRAALALQSGADAAVTTTEEFKALLLQRSNGRGADAVLITADTRSNQPVETAGEAARSKGIVVAVGAVGMSIPRKVYYEKEIDFRISRSYGPGRYDPAYEEQGRDYPAAYVRWTEQRNMQAFVQLVAERKVQVASLITHRFEIDAAPQAYDLITGKTGAPFLGVLLTYPAEPDLRRKIELPSAFTATQSAAPRADTLRLGVLGAGNFANATLLPALRPIPGVALVGIASGAGLSARSTATRFGFRYAASDNAEIYRDDCINTVAILTRHHLHAAQVLAGLEAGKHVFVEKPLCLTEPELHSIVEAYRTARSARPGQTLMVGFNRRFAPFVAELKTWLQEVQEPLVLNYRVNAGYIPPNHWTQDPAQGGGRLAGEACHFIDLLVFLAASAPRRVTARALPDSGRYCRDNLVVTLEFANGSIGTVTYVANGARNFAKESLEVFGGGLAAALDDYRTLTVRRAARQADRTALLRQDKGHRGEWQALANYLAGKGPEPIPFEEIVQSTGATLAAQASLEGDGPVEINAAPQGREG